MEINSSSFKKIIVKSIDEEKKFTEKMMELERQSATAENLKDIDLKIRVGHESANLYRKIENYTMGKMIAMVMAVEECPNFQYN